MNGSQQVAVIESKGDQTTIESVTLKDISKYIKDDIGFSYHDISAQAGEQVITVHRKHMQLVR